MKEFFRSFFASLLAMVAMGAILFILIISAVVSFSRSLDEKEEKRMGDIITIDLSKTLHEQSGGGLLAMLNDGRKTAGLYEVMRAIDKARTDAKIKGILLKLAPSPNGWAEMQQLRNSVIGFRKSGKFVYAYGENITQGAYFLASAADSVYLNPAGSIELKGLYTTLAFFKHTLEMLEIKPEIFYAGKFKSATEPFREEKMTEPNRLQLTQLQKGLWDQYLAGVSEYTHTDTATINAWAQTGAIRFPADALKHHLVAGLLYWDEVEQRLKSRTGKSKDKDLKLVSIDDYAAKNKPDEGAGSQRVAVLFAEGEIVDGEQKNENTIASRTICDEIRKIRKDDKVKAVVLRVNSPGGSALASDVILRELALLKAEKPLVVSMGDYAASGGYYISCKADSIFAMPNTITGSIGVFGMMFSIDKLMKDKLGVTFDGVKNAPFADMPNMTRPLTDEEGKIVQSEIDTIYALFKGHVAAGRRIAPWMVDSIAQGRVWTGTDAKAIGLVDALGGLDRAIAAAAHLGRVNDYRVVTFPEPTDKFNYLLRKLSDNESAKAAVKAAIKEEVGEGYDWYERLRSLTRMNGKAQMALPFDLKVQ